MRKLIFILAATFMIATQLPAQETNDGKTIWAISILNEQAPELKIEKWISETPEMEGKFILLEFWATWCGPCRKAIPKLNDWHKTFKDDLIVIGLSHEPEQDVLDMINPKIEYYSAIDTRALTKDQLDVQGIPHALLITPKGKVVWEGFPLLGGYELTTEKIEALIAKYKDQ